MHAYAQAMVVVTSMAVVRSRAHDGRGAMAGCGWVGGKWGDGARVEIHLRWMNGSRRVDGMGLDQWKGCRHRSLFVLKFNDGLGPTLLLLEDWRTTIGTKSKRAHEQTPGSFYVLFCFALSLPSPGLGRAYFEKKESWLDRSVWVDGPPRPPPPPTARTASKAAQFKLEKLKIQS